MLEQLECRRLLHATHISLSQGVLYIEGEIFKDTVSVTRASTRVIVQLSGFPAKSFPENKVKTILIRTYDGNDNIFAAKDIAARVLVAAGPGDDRIVGGSSNDQLHGMDGRDTIDGQGGNDLIDGGDGNDVLTGGDGNDQLDGRAGNDTADYSHSTSDLTIRLDNKKGDGERGESDTVGADIENVLGGSGNDSIIGSDARNVLSGGGGNDTLAGGGGNDVLKGGAGNDILRGGDGNDNLDGGIGTDRLFGDSGNDAFRTIDNAKDVLDGGEGKDSAKRDKSDVLKSVP